MKKTGKTNKKILKLLYRSFDTELSQRQKLQLERELEKSEELRREKQLILERRKVLADSTTKSFRPQFADRVMAHIMGLESEAGSPEPFYEALKVAFRRFVLVGALAMLALIFFNVIKGEMIPVEEVFFASDLAFEEILNLPLF
jgi:hypothetical protein